MVIKKAMESGMPKVYKEEFKLFDVRDLYANRNTNIVCFACSKNLHCEKHSNQPNDNINSVTQEELQK